MLPIRQVRYRARVACYAFHPQSPVLSWGSVVRRRKECCSATYTASLTQVRVLLFMADVLLFMQAACCCLCRQCCCSSQRCCWQCRCFLKCAAIFGGNAAVSAGSAAVSVRRADVYGAGAIGHALMRGRVPYPISVPRIPYRHTVFFVPHIPEKVPHIPSHRSLSQNCALLSCYAFAVLSRGMSCYAVEANLMSGRVLWDVVRY
eukprot:2620101-Rhodomonas_salina.1